MKPSLEIDDFDIDCSEAEKPMEIMMNNVYVHTPACTEQSSTKRTIISRHMIRKNQKIANVSVDKVTERINGLAD